MIELQVAGYCHECDNFEPTLENRCYDYSDDVRSKVVVCSSRYHCYQMMRYLERQYEKEMSNK